MKKEFLRSDFGLPRQGIKQGTTHSEIGYNYRMSNILAGIGRGQLKVLDQRIAKKYIFEFYRHELGQLDGIKLVPINEWNEPNYWLTCITLNGRIKPMDIILALEKRILRADYMEAYAHTACV